MTRRSSFSKPNTIDLRGVLGRFKVPNAQLTVEYFLTYASLNADVAGYGQLLELLAPVREVFKLDELTFDQLLQRDLDDFRVSTKMVPYLLGSEQSNPHFFPPIVSVIVPWNSNGNMENLYPSLIEEDVEEDNVKLRVSKFGNVFSVKTEVNEDGELARSPVDLIIHQTNARLVIVDGQHRAMAMLATYRSAFNKWSNSPFKYFYEGLNHLEVDGKTEQFGDILLPICIVYFPELTKDKLSSLAEMDLTKACRKLFLDVNKNARQPSEARQILLNDTDIAALYTRFIFNKFQDNKKSSGVRLYHTEYDNPHNRVPITRRFAITDVYTIYTFIQQVLMSTDDAVRSATATSGKYENHFRLQRELELGNFFTQKELDKLSVKRYEYPKDSEEKLKECFNQGWGTVIVNTLSKLYPFAKHIESVNTILKEGEPYTGPNEIAYTALVEGQGLRFTLEEQQGENKKHRKVKKISDKTDAEKAWDVLLSLEGKAEKLRAKSYLPLIKDDATTTQLEKVNRVYSSFRTNAFQTGLFMAFAFLKSKLNLDNEEFIKQSETWLDRLNKRFQNDEKVRRVLFDYQEQNSLRRSYKPSGGLSPGDWTFFRYVVLELLNPKRGNEKGIIDEAVNTWRGQLYQKLVTRKRKEIGDDKSIDIDAIALNEMIRVYEDSLDVPSDEIKKAVRKSSNESDENDELIVPEVDDDTVTE